MSQNIIKREIKMYSKLKENQNSKNQNLWHLNKTIHKDKGWYYNKTESSQVHDLRFQIKKLEKREQIKSMFSLQKNHSYNK